MSDSDSENDFIIIGDSSSSVVPDDNSNKSLEDIADDLLKYFDDRIQPVEKKILSMYHILSSAAASMNQLKYVLMWVKLQQQQMQVAVDRALSLNDNAEETINHIQNKMNPLFNKIIGAVMTEVKWYQDFMLYIQTKEEGQQIAYQNKLGEFSQKKFQEEQETSELQKLYEEYDFLFQTIADRVPIQHPLSPSSSNYSELGHTRSSKRDRSVEGHMIDLTGSSEKKRTKGGDTMGGDIDVQSRRLNQSTNIKQNNEYPSGGTSLLPRWFLKQEQDKLIGSSSSSSSSSS